MQGAQNKMKAASKPINAGPTKAFFVKMLTRDIELADAILDLLDNCVDGVVRELKRQSKAATNGKPYRGFKAAIIAAVSQKSENSSAKSMQSIMRHRLSPPRRNG